MRLSVVRDKTSHEKIARRKNHRELYPRKPRSTASINEAKSVHELRGHLRDGQLRMTLQVLHLDKEQLIRDGCKRLHLEQAEVDRVIALFRRMCDDEMPLLHSISYRGRAAGAVYFVSSRNEFERLTQWRVGEAFGVTEVTVRAVYKKLRQSLQSNPHL